MVFVEALASLYLFVRSDDSRARSLGHQQRFAQRPGALSGDQVRRERDDGAEREHEGVHVVDVEVVGGHGVGDGVNGELLWVGAGEFDHFLCGSNF